MSKRDRSIRLTGRWADSVFTSVDAIDAIYGDSAVRPAARLRAAHVVLAMAAAGRTHEAIRRTNAGFAAWTMTPRYAAVVAELEAEAEANGYAL